MRVLIGRVGDPTLDAPADAFEALAGRDRFGEHVLTSSGEQADVILFPQAHMVDWRLGAIWRTRLAAQFPKKIRIYDERDLPWSGFPGAYVSQPASSFNWKKQRPCGYYAVPMHEENAPADLLFSFVGSLTHRCRQPLLGVTHPDAIVEVSSAFTFWDRSLSDQRRRRRFREVMSRSMFILCPRGRGTSSIRLYEALAAGRVPVVISDGLGATTWSRLAALAAELMRSGQRTANPFHPNHAPTFQDIRGVLRGVIRSICGSVQMSHSTGS
jgi:hypothetical protein